MAIQTRGAPRREAIVSYINKYHSKNGFSPSITEIAEETGMVRSNVHHHLIKLREEGRISYHPHVARSWIVVG